MEKELRKSRTVTVFMILWTNNVHIATCVKSYFTRANGTKSGSVPEVFANHARLSSSNRLFDVPCY